MEQIQRKSRTSSLYRVLVLLEGSILSLPMAGGVGVCSVVRLLQVVGQWACSAFTRSRQHRLWQRLLALCWLSAASQASLSQAARCPSDHTPHDTPPRARGPQSGGWSSIPQHPRVLLPQSRAAQASLGAGCRGADKAV